MATTYPTTLDAFVNPAATDVLNSATVPHAAQHDNINDAVKAMQVVLMTRQPAPTVASATTIAPTTDTVFISGITTIQTITAPSGMATTNGRIYLIPTGIFTTGTLGNIALASTAVVSRVLTMTWDATAAKWYPSY